MEKFLFEDVSGVVDKLLEEWDKLEEKKKEDYTISVVSHYNIMKDIINYLVKNTSFMLCDIELEEPNYRNYYDEYILTIDSNLEIWCQKAKLDNDKYVRVEDSITFVHSDVNSKFVVINKNECLIEFDFGSEEETVCDCDECCGCCCNNELAIETDDNMHGFTVNRSNENGYSSYSFFSTDMGLVEQMAKMFK